MFTISRRSSSAVSSLQVNPFTGVVLVEFNQGYTYEYNGVSRRAILNLMLNPNMSLGFWVNANLLNASTYAAV